MNKTQNNPPEPRTWQAAHRALDQRRAPLDDPAVLAELEAKLARGEALAEELEQLAALEAALAPLGRSAPAPPPARQRPPIAAATAAALLLLAALHGSTPETSLPAPQPAVAIKQLSITVESGPARQPEPYLAPNSIQTHTTHTSYLLP